MLMAAPLPQFLKLSYRRTQIGNCNSNRPHRWRCNMQRRRRRRLPRRRSSELLLRQGWLHRRLAEDAKLTRLQHYRSVFPFVRIVRVKVTSPTQSDLTYGFTIEMGP